MRNLTHAWGTWKFSAIDTALDDGVLRVCLAVNTEASETWLFRRTAFPIPEGAALPDHVKEFADEEQVTFRSAGNIQCCKLPGPEGAPLVWIVPPIDLIMRLVTDSGYLAVDFGLFAEDKGDAESPTLDPGLADELRRLLDDMDSDGGAG